MEVQKAQNLAKVLWRRKLWLILPGLVGACLAVVVVRNMKPRYRASATILVEPQQVPKGFVKDTVTLAAFDRLRLIEQQIMQDEVLEQLVRELYLYPDLIEAGLTSEALLAAKAAVSFAQNSKQRTVDVRVSGPDPETVTLAANRIAELMIEENTKLRLRGSEGTTAFVETQIADAERQLREKRAEISRLKERWYGRLPEQRESNQRAIDELERRLNVVEKGIENAETRRLLLQRAQGAQRTVATTRNEPPGPSRLDQLRLELEALRSRFTAKHPDVSSLEREIAAREEAEIASAASAMPKSVEEIGEEEDDPVLAAELEALDQELGRQRSSREQLLEQIAGYRRLLRGVPSAETELASLEGQRRSLETYYGSLLKKQIEAGMAVALEKRQQSEQFIILERARRPIAPYAPNLVLFLLAGIGLGGALGLGLILLAEQSDAAFHDIDSLKEAFPGVVLLSVIPDLNEPHRPAYAKREKRRKGRKSA